MAKFTEKDFKKMVDEGISKIKKLDIEEILKKEKELNEKFETKRDLKGHINDFKLMLSLLKDYYDGNYKKIPWYSIVAISVTLIYVINPYDIIPDFIPVIGYVDDLTVFVYCLKLIKSDFNDYEEWKRI